MRIHWDLIIHIDHGRNHNDSLAGIPETNVK